MGMMTSSLVLPSTAVRPPAESLWGSPEAVRLLVYSHDGFGLGNIRRMIAVCEHLYQSIPGISILILTGSPVLHSFRLARGIDYVKLPCLGRDSEGNLRVKYLRGDFDHVVNLRRALIQSAVTNFRPNVFLVDKKPGGLAGEIEQSLEVIKRTLPNTAVLLLLRDILDDAESTIEQWKRQSCYELVAKYFDEVVVAGLPEIFDVREEYRFPAPLRDKVRFCGYIGRGRRGKPREAVRNELGVGEKEPLVLVTTGGGEDGFNLIETYLEGLATTDDEFAPKRSLIVTGPELAAFRQEQVRSLASRRRGVQVIEFTDDLLSYLNAADVVVSMAGYNTICEILSLRKRAIVVPRVTPVREQKIRAERMARLSLFKTVHPNRLTPGVLMDLLKSELRAAQSSPEAPAAIEMNALPRIAQLVRNLTAKTEAAGAGALHSSPTACGNGREGAA